ncbi:hypothetical protein C7Y71_005850 [Pseudoprevotella muciniphila]|uniref:Uncharacterized protein n=1 Tax=Pseudoprevotella muciniphila TaxID=2133944 RepID=A0A5P8E6L1_9BACT|nr:hypothetical protein C7Y71_005850 [Pseudoprevotella muciniphila]
MPADVTKVERFQIPEMGCMKKYEHCHNLCVRNTAGAVAMLFSIRSNKVFFSSGLKILQNSSKIQYISTKFAVVMGVEIILLIN